MKRAIVTNDDGINSQGIRDLVKALSNYMEVYVFAPDCQKSAMSQALLFREPITVRERKVSGASYACEVSGSPADAVKIGLRYFSEKTGLCIQRNKPWRQYRQRYSIFRNLRRCKRGCDERH